MNLTSQKTIAQIISDRTGCKMSEAMKEAETYLRVSKWYQSDYYQKNKYRKKEKYLLG